MSFLRRSTAVMAAVSLAGGVLAATPGVASAARANQVSAGTSAGASGPLGTGPIFQQTKLTAADGAAFDQLGSTVAISGDTMVAGVPAATIGDNNLEGAVYVFQHTPLGWTQEAKLTASDGSLFEQFGSSVAISGDTIFAAAPAATVGDNGGQGAVYVFTGHGSHWTQEAKLTVTDGASEDNLGFSLAASGNTVVAGAPNATVGGNGGQGAAYVFTGHGSRWSLEAKLAGADGAAFDQFGWSVGISGNKVIAGALSAEDAYVFARRGGSWEQEAKLTNPDGPDEFGYSVAISGDTALVGAPLDGNNGAAYVFAQDGSGWTEQATLTTADFDGSFGYSVAISRRTLVVGEPLLGDDGLLFQGAAYVFSPGLSGWTEQAELTGGDDGDFGYSVGVSDGTIVAGAPTDTINGNSLQGAAYLYQAGLNRPPAT